MAKLTGIGIKRVAKAEQDLGIGQPFFAAGTPFVA